jgi:hypothetical protein
MLPRGDSLALPAARFGTSFAVFLCRHDIIQQPRSLHSDHDK